MIAQITIIEPLWAECSEALAYWIGSQTIFQPLKTFVSLMKMPDTSMTVFQIDPTISNLYDRHTSTVLSLLGVLCEVGCCSQQLRRTGFAASWRYHRGGEGGGCGNWTMSIAMVESDRLAKVVKPTGNLEGEECNQVSKRSGRARVFFCTWWNYQTEYCISRESLRQQRVGLQLWHPLQTPGSCWALYSKIMFLIMTIFQFFEFHILPGKGTILNEKNK